MIVTILASGRSFKKLGDYLLHDADADTDERVAWTHTRNLANDHISSAIDEMLWTARDAELLKQQAGVRAGGRESEKVVKHLSLNWSPDDNPTREHMVETAEEFLRHMKWDEHQAIFVAHDDRAHKHVHVMLNAVNPETGLKLNDDFERRRAQEWALRYEREQGKIYCETRLENVEDREASPTRPMWLAFRNSQIEFQRDENARANFAEAENTDAENPENQNSREWKRLKEFQREQRTAWFAEGKVAFSEMRRDIYLDVREQFRDRWSDYFDAVRTSGKTEALETYRAALVAEQKGVLKERRDEAYAMLKEVRVEGYEDLLRRQSGQRTLLEERQQVGGLDFSAFMRALEEKTFSKKMETLTFREAAAEVTVPTEDTWQRPLMPLSRIGREKEDSGLRPHSSIATGLAFGAASALAGVADSLGDAFTAGPRAPRERPKAPERKDIDLFEFAARDAQKRQENQKEQEDADYRRRQQERYWE